MIGIVLHGPWTGIAKLSEQELKRLRKPIEQTIVKAQLLFESEVKKTLTGKRTGRIYMRGTKTKGRRQANGRFAKKGTASRDVSGRFIRAGSYQASAPGEAPALVSGRLRQSITHSPVVWSDDHASGDVGTNAPQAHLMEFGGVTGAGHHVRILPRPYMAPTFLRVEGQLVNILAEATRA